MMQFGACPTSSGYQKKEQKLIFQDGFSDLNYHTLLGRSENTLLIRTQVSKKNPPVQYGDKSLAPRAILSGLVPTVNEKRYLQIVDSIFLFIGTTFLCFKMAYMGKMRFFCHIATLKLRVFLDSGWLQIKESTRAGAIKTGKCISQQTTCWIHGTNSTKSNFKVFLKV